MKPLDKIYFSNNKEIITLCYLGNDQTEYPEAFAIEYPIDEPDENDLDLQTLADESWNLGYSISNELINSRSEDIDSIKAKQFLEKLKYNYTFQFNQPIIYAKQFKDLILAMNENGYILIQSAKLDMLNEIK